MRWTWLLPRKPRSVRSFAVAWKRLRGPAGVALVGRDGAAQRDAAAAAQRAERGLEVLAADVVEVDVDAVRRGRAQQLVDRAVVVVEGGVEAELVAQVRDLVGRAGAADHAVAAQLGDLRGERADRAGGGRDPDDVAVAQLGGVQQPGVRGEADAAERAEVGLGGRGRAVEPRERPEPAQRRLARAHDRVLAPAGRVPDEVAGREAVGA